MNPESNFITSLLNVDPSNIETFSAHTDIETAVYEVTLKRVETFCPYCGCQTISYGHNTKRINHPVLRDRKCYILYHANRYQCKGCGKVFMEHNPFSFPGFNSSTLLLQQVMNLFGNLNYTLDMISKELNISTTQLNTYLDSFITIPKRSLPESLGIDEIHNRSLARKTSPYLCILVDNENHCLYDVLDSRAKYSLADHFSKISREERLGVKYVSIDMWEPYRDLAAAYFPNAVVAVDSFHVIEHLCNDFEKLRIKLMRSCDYHSNGYYLLKKWSWLLMKDDINLDNERIYNHRFGTELNRRDIRDMIFETFPILHDAYELKELYRKFNQISYYDEAVKFFPRLQQYFAESGISEYYEFSGILSHWKDEILNSFMRPYGDRRLSNAYTENINGKLRSYFTIARGVKNFDRFRKRAIYALNPQISYALTTRLKADTYKGRERGPYQKIRD